MRRWKGLMTWIAIVGTSGVAAAQDRGDRGTRRGDDAADRDEDAGEAARDVGEEAHWFGAGLVIFIGGGVESFVSGSVDDTTSVGGTWDARVVLGSRSRIAFEAGYIGSAADVQAQIGNADATLVGTTLEAVGRWNAIVDRPVVPYGFVGLGWRHYEVVGADFATSATGMEDSDDLLTVPVGVGLSYRFEQPMVRGLSADLRATFRANLGPDLVLEDPTDPDRAFAAMHTWDLGAKVGYEF